MRSCRLKRRWLSHAFHSSLLCCALAGASLLSPGHVAAQSEANLSTETVMVSSSLSPAQQSQIDRYVDVWTSRLLSQDNPQAMAQARRRLVDPFSLPGVTELFLAAYSPALSRALSSRDALQSDSPVVRTNAMIVASHLTSSSVVPLIQQGMRDSVPAVRYWAAIAAANAASRLDSEDQQTLLRVFNNAWENETSMEVLGKLLVAMDALNIPEASAQLLAVLNHRVAIHAGDPTMPIRAELQGLEGVTVRTFSQLTSNNNNVSPETLRQLVVVLFRYFDLATKIQTQNPDSPHSQDMQRLMRIAGNYLPRLAKRLNPEAPLGSLESRQVNPADLASTRLLVEEWRSALVTGGFGITQGQLDIVPRQNRQPAAPGTPATTEPAQDAADQPENM